MCKRIFIVLVLFVCGMAGVWADEIDEKEALEQAQQFLDSHIAALGRKSSPKLTLEGQVSGLYVFNVANKGGFIIVSNDDDVKPILGFGDNGNIDTKNMPANMRAWLQGYADEIAWLKTQSKQSGQRAQGRAPRRVGSHATTAIAPLVSTTWNQDAPYNNLCPKYDGTNQSATGCVATAMAQVMKYHEWPKEDTTNVIDGFTTIIPGYTTASYGIVLTDLPAIRFDWANMKNTYTGSETDATADAVATLMQYCGNSVEMDYGPESGSNTDKVATALKAYFDYNETTQFVSRSMYTLANWTDLIYHELSQNRPVVYGGMSSGGGHEFVCDGYKYENETDYFHINWGWGGQSDNYFVLSALNPNQQGIGGSSSNDSFHYGQDAVIGIQPSTGTGTVANIPTSNIDLTLNSMTLSNTPAIAGLPVSVILNVTNNSTDDYDGDLWVGVKDGDDYYLLDGSNFLIPAGATVDCVGSFTPTATGTYDLVFFLPNAVGSYNTDGVVRATLTVEEATMNEYVPVYGYYVDQFSRSQFVIPATNLEGMLYANLNGMTFYSTLSSSNWGTAEFDVYLSEASESSISALKDWDSLEKVYAGALSISNGKMVITFDNPYQYMGGNLLVGINQTVSDGNSYSNDKWIGTSATGASMGGYGTSISQKDFLPYTTFDYTPGEAPANPSPTGLTVSSVTAETATLAWNSPGGEVTGYVYQYKKSSDEDWSAEANTTNTGVTLEGLTAATAYNFRVKAVYAGGESTYTVANFTTKLSDDVCSITLELTDSYGDGWNGAAIKIVDVLSGIEIGTYSNTDAAEGGEAQVYLVPVPNDRDIQFQWVSGGYDAECSYVTYNVGGDVIFSGSGTMSSAVTYHVDCRYAPVPKDLLISNIGPSSAILSWTGVASNYDVRYGLLPVTGFGSGWLKYDDGTYSNSIGSSTASNRTWGVMYPASQVTGNKLTKVSFYENTTYNKNDITVNIYSGGDTPSDTPLYTEVITPTGSDGFHEVTLATPVSITPLQNLWITLSENGAHVMICCNSTEPNNQWILNGSNWTTLGSIESSLASLGWMIRGYFESTTDPSTVEWTTTSTSNDSYTITGLTTETNYVVQVRGDYGSDGKGEWATGFFKTTPSNPVPTDLSAELVSDGATLTWIGYGDSYNVQYRTAAKEEVLFFDGFESGMDRWTIIRNGGGTNDTDWHTITPMIYFESPMEAHSGEYVAISKSWYNNIAYNVDNWLISPQVTLDGTLRFWVKDDGTYHEHYDIYVSTTGKAIADFTLLESPGNASGTWTEVSVDLSGYAGQKGYIALRNTDKDQDYLLIDDFGIFKSSTPAGAWQSLASVTQATATLSGLATNNGYEYRIQSVKGGNTSDWSETGEFALLTLQDEADNSSLIYNNTGRLAHVTLQGRTLYKDGNWNTLCLPFSLDATQLAASQLAGAYIRALNTASFSNSTLTLNFTDENAVSTITTGTPYIIKWASSETNIENPTFTGVTISNANYDKSCDLGDGKSVTFKGTYKKLSYTAETASILFLGGANTLYYPLAGASIGAQRAYFELSGLTAGDKTNLIRGFVLNFGDGQTGISEAAPLNDKGQMTNDNWYSLDGRRLDSVGAGPVPARLRKGMYIHNGKKRVIK